VQEARHDTLARKGESRCVAFLPQTLYGCYWDQKRPRGQESSCAWLTSSSESVALYPERLGRRIGGRRVSAERFAEIGAAARQARSQKASQVRAELLPTITAIQATGASSLRAIAAELNAREIPPPKSWGMVCCASSKGDATIV